MKIPHRWKRVRARWQEQRDRWSEERLRLHERILELEASRHEQESASRLRERDLEARAKREREHGEALRAEWSANLEALRTELTRRLTEERAAAEAREERLREALEAARRDREEAATAWRAERIRIIREWELGKKPLPDAPAPEAEAQAAHRAAEEAWRLREGMLEGEAAWLREEIASLRRTQEARVRALEGEFATMTERVLADAMRHEAEVKSSYEAALAKARAEAEEHAERAKALRIEAEGLQASLHRRDQSFELAMARYEGELERAHTTFDAERVRERDRRRQDDEAWARHADGLRREVQAWKTSWDRREQEAARQLEDLHRAHLASEEAWRERLGALEASARRTDLEGTVARAAQGADFAERVERQLELLAQAAKPLAGGDFRREVFEEARAYILRGLGEYRSKLGQEWEERVPSETALLKALDACRLTVASAHAVGRP